MFLTCFSSNGWHSIECSENMIFFKLKEFNSTLIQDSIAKSANIIRSRFYSLNDIFKHFTSFFSFLYSNFNTRFSCYLLLPCSNYNVAFSEYLLFYILCAFLDFPSFWFFNVLFYFLGFPGGLIFEILFSSPDFHSFYIFYIPAAPQDVT